MKAAGRHHAVIALALLAAAGMVGTAGAQTWPQRPITLIIPFPAGGGTDVLGRLLAQKLAPALGQNMVIDNRPGAGGSIAAETVARAAPDGYTLFLATNSTQSIGPLLAAKPTYNPQTDFTPIAFVGTAPRLLLVHRSIPAPDVKALIALARARPGELNYASNGVGTITHLTTELFKSLAGVALEHVPYKGTTLALGDLVAGQVHMIFESIVTGLPHVKEGRLRGLAITSARRSALAPQLPTMSEAGVPGFEAATWFGFFGPRALPPAIVNRANGEINRALADREVLDRMGPLGIDPGGGTPAELAAVVAADTQRWARVIKERRIALQ